MTTYEMVLAPGVGAIHEISPRHAFASTSEPSGASSATVIDAMWAYAHEMIPDVTGALDDVDPSVVHLDPHNG